MTHGQKRLALPSSGTHCEVMENKKDGHRFNETEELLFQPHVATLIHPLSLVPSLPPVQRAPSGQACTKAQQRGEVMRVYYSAITFL